MPTAISRPFKSADGRVTYVTMSSGQRRRVKIVDGEIVFHAREGKGAKKSAKRERQKAARVLISSLT